MMFHYLGLLLSAGSRGYKTPALQQGMFLPVHQFARNGTNGTSECYSKPSRPSTALPAPVIYRATWGRDAGIDT